MRIGLIAPPWLSVPPARYGGTERVVDVLARGLRAAGEEVVLFSTGDATCPVPRRYAYAEPIEPMGTTIPELYHVRCAYEALAGCDIVHDHTVAGPVWAATRPTPPVVATNHSPYTRELGALYADAGTHVAIVAISHSQRATAPGVPIAAVIHHGLDPDRFPVGRGDGGYVLFLGRLSPEKGASRAIRIARAAGVPLRIAGRVQETVEREYFDRRIRPALGPEVEFLGELGSEDCARQLGGAVALLNPIRWNEPFGLVMIEALACGTPVITRPVGAAPEIVQHGVTGYLCTSFRQAVQAVTSAPALDRGCCRGAVEGHFSAARMVAQHTALYRRVCHANRSATRLRRQGPDSWPAAVPIDRPTG